ncbi:hypothetical protein C8J57DRAFT_1511818 [Mycena rebaudengoi]|nr:hypothetical protein C8J57DRAFT_1511818 [Mycena rebaudengoi]
MHATHAREALLWHLRSTALSSRQRPAPHRYPPEPHIPPCVVLPGLPLSRQPRLIRQKLASARMLVACNTVAARCSAEDTKLATHGTGFGLRPMQANNSTSMSVYWGYINEYKQE